MKSFITKYRDLSVSRRSIICLSLRLRQIIDLLATDKSRYFAQPRPIIVKCSTHTKAFFLTDCSKTGTKVITVTNHKGHRKSTEAILNSNTSLENMYERGLVWSAWQCDARLLSQSLSIYKAKSKQINVNYLGNLKKYLFVSNAIFP